jgi:hypothetical protein
MAHSLELIERYQRLGASVAAAQAPTGLESWHDEWAHPAFSLGDGTRVYTRRMPSLFETFPTIFVDGLSPTWSSRSMLLPS